MFSLSDAIANVEKAGTQLSNADTAQQQAQTKYDAAKAAKDDADKADSDAVAAFNSSLERSHYRSYGCQSGSHCAKRAATGFSVSQCSAD